MNDIDIQKLAEQHFPKIPLGKAENGIRNKLIESFIAGYTASKWISVNDTNNVPKLTQEYLIACTIDAKFNSNNKINYCVTTAYYVEAMDFRGNKITYWAEKESFEPIMYVTHWMELPKFPQP